MSETIKVLLLDIDGVLTQVQWGNQNFYEPAFEQNFGIKYPECKKVIGEGMVSPTLVTKHPNLKQRFSKVFEAKELPHTGQDVMDYWFDEEAYPTSTLGSSLNQIAVPFYLATNQEMFRFAHLVHDRGLADYAHGAFVSGLLGVRKPEQEYYAHCWQVIRRNHQLENRMQVLFLDDTEENTVAAKQFGFQVEHIVQPEDALEIVQKYGLISNK